MADKDQVISFTVDLDDDLELDPLFQSGDEPDDSEILPDDFKPIDFPYRVIVTLDEDDSDDSMPITLSVNQLSDIVADAVNTTIDKILDYLEEDDMEEGTSFNLQVYIDEDTNLEELEWFIVSTLNSVESDFKSLSINIK